MCNVAGRDIRKVGGAEFEKEVADLIASRGVLEQDGGKPLRHSCVVCCYLVLI